MSKLEAQGMMFVGHEKILPYCPPSNTCPYPRHSQKIRGGLPFLYSLAPTPSNACPCLRTPTLCHPCRRRPSIPCALPPLPLPLASAPFARYEVNPDLVPKLEAQGMMFVGRDETGERMEILELSSNPCDHPFFVAAQFHPEFKSRWVRGVVEG